MRLVIAAFLLAGFGCRAPETGSNSAQVTTFLESWLIDGDLEGARRMFRQEFDEAAAIDADRFPPELRALKRSDRALRYPGSAGCRTRCSTLDECISSDGGSGAFQTEPAVIHAELVREYTDLAGLEGKNADLITFVFQECNVGATIVFVPELDRPVAMIGFVAPE